MLDMKKFRQHVEVVQKKLKTRGVVEEVLLRFLALDEERSALLVKVEELKKHRNQVSGEIAHLKRAQKDASQQLLNM
ncbi:serine--tRNA ligase, partial [Enterococcus faecalis]